MATTRITLADYIRRNLPLIPPEDLCRNVGLSVLNDAHMVDTTTIVELDDDGQVLKVYRPKLVSTAPPEPEPEPEPAPAEEPQSQYDLAVSRIFPDYEPGSRPEADADVECDDDDDAE